MPYAIVCVNYDVVLRSCGLLGELENERANAEERLLMLYRALDERDRSRLLRIAAAFGDEAASPAKKQSRVIPLYRFLAAAGIPSPQPGEDYEELSVAEDDPADFAARIAGDSMEPYYHDGNIAWVHECQELSVGDVGIFTYDGDGYIKEYDEQEPDDELKEIYTDSDGVVHMQPILRSFNPKYVPKVITPNAYFRIVGKVLN